MIIFEKLKREEIVMIKTKPIIEYRFDVKWQFNGK